MTPPAPGRLAARIERHAFAALLAAQTLLILPQRPFPTQDGPAHLYGAELLRAWASGRFDPYAGAFARDPDGGAQVAFHGVLAALSALVDPARAEAVAAAIASALLCIALRVVLRAAGGGRAVLLWPFLFPLGTGAYLFLGFFAFQAAFAVSLLLLAVLPPDRRPTTRRIAAAGAMALAASALHPLGWAMGAVVFAALRIAGGWHGHPAHAGESSVPSSIQPSNAPDRGMGVPPMTGERESSPPRSPTRGRASGGPARAGSPCHPYWLLLAVLALPALLVLALAPSSAGGGFAYRLPLSTARDLVLVRPSAALHLRETIPAAGAAWIAALAGLVLLASPARWAEGKRAGRRRGWRLLGATAAAVVLLFAVPDRIHPNALIDVRLAALPLLGAFCWLGAVAPRRWLGPLFVVGLVGCVGVLALRVDSLRVAQRHARAVESILAPLAQGDHLLPIVVDRYGHASDEARLSLRASALLHRASLAAARARAVDLKYYQPMAGGFPFAFLPEVDPARTLAVERGSLEDRPPRLRLVDGRLPDAPRIDWALLAARPGTEHAESFDAILRASGFERHSDADDGLLVLYRRERGDEE